MYIERIRTVYFSPTGGTKNAARLAAGCLSEALGIPRACCGDPINGIGPGDGNERMSAEGEIDLTPPAAREREYRFGPRELVVVGSPVYAGRLPNKIAPDLKRCIKGNAVAVPVVVYGNRSFGGALAELELILRENGFSIAGGAAVVSRHAFTDALANGRPDEADRDEIREFAERIAERVRSAEGCGGSRGADIRDQSVGATGYEALPKVSGWDDIPPYYTPLKEDGKPAKFLKAKPETDRDLCDMCGICRDACPVGSIDERMEAAGLCIKCRACVRKCPKGAKYFTDEDFLSHVRMLEENYTRRADNYFF